jgi:outer membrane protein assembly factor BamE
MSLTTTRQPRLARPTLVLAAGGLALLLAACGSVMNSLQPYRMEIVQGNVVTQEMVTNLKPGLSRDQVRGLLGSPMLSDIFHADRWDYVFTIRRQGAEPQQRRVTVFFEKEKLSRFEAGALPSEKEFVASIDAAKVQKGQATLELSEEQVKALPLPPLPTVAPVALGASGPLRNYPPLEGQGR